MRYRGFFNKDEKCADNTEFFRDCVNNPMTLGEIGLTLKKAKELLWICEKFPPEKPHDRVIGHFICIYSVKPKIWEEKRRNIVSAKGSLKELEKFDISDLVKNACEAELEKKSPRVSDKLKIPNDNLKIICNNTRFARNNWFFYSFDIDRNSIDMDNPKEYHIHKYLKMDDKIITETKEIARIGFQARNFLPVQYKKMIYSETIIRKIPIIFEESCFS